MLSNQLTTKEYAAKLAHELHAALKLDKDITPTLAIAENFFVDNSHCLQNEPKAYKKLKKAYRKGVKKVSTDLEVTSRQVFLELDHFSCVEIDNSCPKSHLNCTNYMNNLSWKIINDILSYENLDQRTLVMERWIRVMNKNFNKGDYQTVSAILSALSNAAINRLVNTHNGLSEKAKKIKDKIEELAHVQRVHLIENRDQKHSIIPPFDYYKLHFTQMQEVVKKYKNDKAMAEKNGVTNQAEKIQTFIDLTTFQIKQHEEQVKQIQKQVLEMRGAVAKNHYCLLTATVLDDEKSLSSIAYKKSKLLESPDKENSSSSMSQIYPDLLLKKDKVHVSSQVEQSIEIGKIESEIGKINIQVLSAISSLREYSHSKDHSKNEKFKKINADFVLDGIKTIESLLEKNKIDSKKKDPLNKDHLLSAIIFLNFVLSIKVSINEHTHADWFKKMRKIETTLVLHLKALKELLNKALELQLMKWELENIKSNKIYSNSELDNFCENVQQQNHVFKAKKVTTKPCSRVKYLKEKFELSTQEQNVSRPMNQKEQPAKLADVKSLVTFFESKNQLANTALQKKSSVGVTGNKKILAKL